MPLMMLHGGVGRVLRICAPLTDHMAEGGSMNSEAHCNRVWLAWCAAWRLHTDATCGSQMLGIWTSLV